MKRKNPRSFVQQMSSEYIQPSKYLICENEDDHETASNIGTSRQSKIQTRLVSDHEEHHLVSESDQHPISSPNNNQFFEIGTDCLELIFSYLTYQDMASILFISHQWCNIIVPLFYEETFHVLQNNEHLIELKKEGRDYDEDGYDGLFTESATWKPTLCYDTDDNLDAAREELIQYSDSEDDEEIDDDKSHILSNSPQETTGSSACTTNNEIKDSGNDVTSSPKISNLQHTNFDKRLPFGTPLCKNTIQDQFYLVQDALSKDEYVELIEQYLKINMKDTMNHQDGHEQLSPLYINPFLFYDQIQHEQAQIKPYMWEVAKAVRRDGRGPIVVGNFSGHTIYSDDEYYEHYQASDWGFVFYALRGESDSQYHERWYPDPEYKGPYCNDELDSDLKLNHYDIANAVEKEHNTEDNTQQEANKEEENGDNINQDDDDEDLDDEEDWDFTDDESEDENIENTNYIDNCMTDLTNLQHKNSHDFIDDSELIKDENIDANMNDNERVDSLQDRLIKVSMQVHEEVYGHEKTHSEKLYLKNWYGNGNLFFAHAAKHLGDDNPEILMSGQEEEIDDDKTAEDNQHNPTNTSNSQGMVNMEENVANERQADEETSKEYHLSAYYENDLLGVLKRTLQSNEN
ncbi:hypothetical protein C9374_001900 [Naegleria lovaniensis]|uniref:F-box domain-containing protein n=1 Tax=Naegleria lovaniensis TaxID=51637 RepID=A0AA88GTZ8_NAELO|nr:uncharacterized protein C9374_001900 [Naegleria lovaniensis]KAG2386865.1 hypothetical protein C9374_001900 [Naegleria lovaniensis]